MKILKFNGNLRDIMGEDAVLNPVLCGLAYYDGHQDVAEDGSIVTLMEVIDETLALKYEQSKFVEVLDENSADIVLVEMESKIKYKVVDHSLYSANINQLVLSNELDLKKMDVAWSNTEELEYLYNIGISGIVKKQKSVKKYKSIKLEKEAKL